MIRTGYSFKTAIGHIGEVVQRLKEIGWKDAPICDRISTFGFVSWAEETKKAGMRPVFGVEIGVAPETDVKKPIVDYWRFIAKDDLQPLHKLIDTATQNPGKEPLLLYKQAMEAKGIIKITGDMARLDQFKPQPDLYIGLSPGMNLGQYRSVVKAKHKFVAVSQNFYPRAGDLDLYRVMLGRRADSRTYPCHILDDEEWKVAVSHIADAATIKKALSNRAAILKNSKATIQTATMMVPEKKKTLRQMCIEGAKKLKCDLKNPIYAERLDKELNLIDDKKFEDYFYIIADMINWAKERMIVGPARGSSCGSLVCYLLGITTIDPIPYDLIFERFIDINRTDLPDIDIDFSDKRRDLVFKYVEDKYGKERVARLGTVGMFQPRSALNTAGASLLIPKWKIERTLEGVIERSSGDSRALQALEDTLKDTEAGRQLVSDHPEILMAARMEGHPNASSQHAAGIVITKDPVTNFVAVDRRTGATMCDKYDAETFNLLKIDALGLTQLSIFERTMELIGEKPRSGWLEKLPLDDPKAFDVINQQKWSGIFQFNGPALQSLAKQIESNHIEDIISVTALARPGPLASGGANEWVKRRTGKSPVVYPHPLFEPHLKGTLGIVMYQEQVMQIGREIGDLSWEDVTALRKAMSKSLGKEFFDRYGDRWKTAAAKKGIPEVVLEKVWDDLCAYGAWAFNRSHSVAYGMVSYWCCWFKAHYPVEFAAATLDAEKNSYNQLAILRELKREGVDYVAVDPKRSTDRWEPVINDEGKQIVVGPLQAIKGIGPMGVKEILTCRKEGWDLAERKPALAKKLENGVTELDSLYPIAERVHTLHPKLEDINIISTPVPIIDAQCGVDGEVLILAVASRIVPRNENEPVLVARRGYELKGPTDSLNLFMKDDTDEIYCKIDRYRFEAIGRPVIERGKPGNALYAIKGWIPPEFRMIKVTNIRYLGDLKDAN